MIFIPVHALNFRNEVLWKALSLFPSSVLTASGSKGISQFFNVYILKDTPKVVTKVKRKWIWQNKFLE
jgi:hypothetical protein